MCLLSLLDQFVHVLRFLFSQCFNLVLFSLDLLLFLFIFFLLFFRKFYHIAYNAVLEFGLFFFSFFSFPFFFNFLESLFFGFGLFTFLLYLSGGCFEVFNWFFLKVFVSFDFAESCLNSVLNLRLWWISWSSSNLRNILDNFFFFTWGFNWDTSIWIGNLSLWISFLWWCWPSWGCLSCSWSLSWLDFFCFGNSLHRFSLRSLCWCSWSLYWCSLLYWLSLLNLSRCLCLYLLLLFLFILISCIIKSKLLSSFSSLCEWWVLWCYLNL